MLNREITMTIPQYNALNRGELTLKEIKEINEADKTLGKIMNDIRMNKILVFTVAALNYSASVFAEPIEAMAKIDTAGAMFLGIIQRIGYWGCIIACLIEILKCLMSTGSKDIWKIMLKYLMIFAALYLMPFAFDLIKDIFA